MRSIIRRSSEAVKFEPAPPLWLFETWEVSTSHPSGESPNGTAHRLTSIEELKQRRAAALADNSIARYKYRQIQADYVLCPKGHRTRHRGDIWPCHCIKRHELYECEKCKTEYTNPPWGPRCGSLY